MLGLGWGVKGSIYATVIAQTVSVIILLTHVVNGRGLMPVRPKEWENRHPLPVTRSPKDVEVVTIGGRGGHDGIILPWALHSEGIVEPIALPDGTIAKSINDFRKK